LMRAAQLIQSLPNPSLNRAGRANHDFAIRPAPQTSQNICALKYIRA
jgi:hypothetical protein